MIIKENLKKKELFSFFFDDTINYSILIKFSMKIKGIICAYTLYSLKSS
jgi:hypothetical protein